MKASNEPAIVKSDLDKAIYECCELARKLLPRGIVCTFFTREDVLSLRENLTDDQAQQVLESLNHDFDASIGINWDVIDETIFSLFGAENDKGDSEYENE